MMLLTRDILAAIALLWIVSTAWDEQTTDNSLAASIRLAFYLSRSEIHHPADPNHHHVSTNILPAVLDVDGDGTPEALSVWKISNETISGSVSAGTTTGSLLAWKIAILDLRPSLSHTAASSISTPSPPKVLLESATVHGTWQTVADDEAVPFQPLVMTTGQVLTHNVRKTVEKKSLDTVANDRTLRYFCGANWHDAAQKCKTHCPSGHSGDCPDGETCYADTPCSAANTKGPHDSLLASVDSLHTTPAGGWPSIFTAWSQGRVTMHSLTAEATKANKTGAKNSKPKHPRLQVVLLWDVAPFLSANNNSSISRSNPSVGINNATKANVVVEWEDVNLVFVDALSAPQNQGSNAGMLIVTGTAMVYRLDQDHNDHDAFLVSGTFVLALDAFTGQTLWRSSSSKELDRALFHHHDQDPVPLPVVATPRGSTSVARRRSFRPGLERASQPAHRDSGSNAGMSTVNCLREYRRSLLTSGALPYQYWGTEEDTSVAVLHFDHQSGGSSHEHQTGHDHGASPHSAKSKKASSQRRASKATSNNHSPTKLELAQKQSRWLSSVFAPKKHRPTRAALSTAHWGRPNVVVTHNYEGIQVRALRNGRSLCHLSLQDHTLYADVNHDGTLDSLQVVTSGSHSPLILDRDDDAIARDRKWVENLARRVAKINGHDGEAASESPEAIAEQLSQTPLCHILALSGMPSREELFSVNVCASGNGRPDVETAQQLDVQGAPLLLVEGNRGHDVIAAVNTGVITRFRGGNGRRVWQWNEKRSSVAVSSFPTWDDPYTVLLGRIDAEPVVSAARPIVLAGQDSVVLLAASSGHLLASSVFPQPSITRPRLVDLNGDGTTDLLVCTQDAVWGYHVVVRTGTSIPFRMLAGLLFMGLMLAVLRNRFGPQPGKRSTDP
jgi:hypothetical protein